MVNENTEPIVPSPNIYSPPSPSEPPPYYGETYSPEPKNKTIKVIIGIVIGILFFSTVGALIALYTRAWDPLWNPFRPEPDKVIQEMSQRMKQVKTIHSESKIEIDTKDEYQLLNILLTLNSDTDNTDSKNAKTSGDFNINFDLKSTGKYVTSSDEIRLSLSGESKALGQVSYFKLNSLPAMIVDSLRNETGIDLNEVLINKWIKIDPESITQSLEDLFKNSYFGGELPSEFSNLFQQQTEGQKELQEKFKKMLEGKKFFIVKKELPDAEISGIKSYHYLMNLDKKELKSLIPEFVIIYVDIIKEMMPPDYPLTENDIYQAKKQITESLNKAFDEFFTKIGDIDGEVWIGKKDYLLYKIKVGKEIDLSKLEEQKREGILQPPPSVQPASKGTITFKVDMNFSNFDKPVIIEAPKESTDIIEIFMPIIQSSLEQARKRAKDARIMSDLYQARTVATIIYDDNFDSYENLCTESLKKFNRAAPTYGTELGQIEDDIKSQQGGTLDLVCLDSVTSYCIVASLVSGGRYCVDSSAIYTGEIQKNQTCVGNGTSQSPYSCPPRSTPIMP